jgi:hypothetical protein
VTWPRRFIFRNGLDDDRIANAFRVPTGPEERQGHLPWELGRLGKIENQPIHQPGEDLDCIDDRVRIRRGAWTTHDEATFAGEKGNVGHAFSSGVKGLGLSARTPSGRLASRTGAGRDPTAPHDM